LETPSRVRSGAASAPVSNAPRSCRDPSPCH